MGEASDIKRMGDSWVIAKEFKFEAAHKLPYHDGKCARLHGHSYRGRVFVAASALVEGGPKTAMVVDFSDIKAVLKPLVDDYLDHRYLNETLGVDHTTAEYLAKWIYDRLAPEISGIVAVEIDETCTSAAFYFGPPQSPGAGGSDGPSLISHEVAVGFFA